MSPIRFIMIWLRGKELRENGPRLTFSRLCTSRHLADLQWIASAILLAMLICFVAVVEWQSLTVSGAILLALLGALNWTYQVGSRRIGAVDLVACEITVLCRVLLVADFARAQVSAFEAGEAREENQQAVPGAGKASEEKPRFTSEEEYTPVYDKLLPDLVSLDVEVVTYVTEFYTYRKTMVDYLRAITVAPPDRREKLQVAMMYMLFLMFESGRHAVRRLVEFEPNQTESVINILCSEIILYKFLTSRFDDYRSDRLELRRGEYVKIEGYLRAKMGESHANWGRARATWQELERRYVETGPWLDPAVAMAEAHAPA